MDFAAPGQQNVSLIYGANGAGKTTLLNAFTWALFDEFTPAFENRTALLNERVRAQIEVSGTAEASVEVCFDHDDRTYVVNRSQSTHRDKEGVLRDGQSTRTVDIQGPVGPPERPVETAANVIAQILPSALHQFFFFDGERIEGLVKQGTTGQVLDKAIKVILGLEVLEQVNKYLPLASSKLRASMKNYDKGTTDDLRSAIERGERETIDLEESVVQMKTNRAANEVAKAEAETFLRDNAVARERQLRLDSLRKQDVSLGDELEALRRDTKLALSDRGFVAFSSRLATGALEAVEDLREKGRLPAAYERQFLNDLLAQNTCLCGAPLDENSSGRHMIESLLPAAGLRDFQECWNRISADATRFLDDRSAVRDRLASNAEAITRAEDDLNKVKQEIDGVKELQAKSTVSSVADFAASRDDFERKIRDQDLSIHLNERKLAEKQNLVHDLKSNLLKAEIQDDRGKVLQRQMSAADRITDAVKRILQIRRDQTREQLDQRIKQTYGQITFKAYVPELTSDFRLQLTKTVGTLEDVAVSKSQGENQLLALSFVGALARLAREKFDERATGSKDSLSNFEGGVFPLVMDSPFGALDDNYRREVAHAIPLLAPQVVTMVSKSQGQGVVQDQLYGRIGRSYVLVFVTPKRSIPPEYLDIDGKSLPYIEHSTDEYESAKIVEVF